MPSTARGIASQMRTRRRQLERLDARLQRQVAIEVKRILRSHRASGGHLTLHSGADIPELGALLLISGEPGHPIYDDSGRVVAAIQRRLGRMGMAWTPTDRAIDGYDVIAISVMGPGHTEVRGHLSPNRGGIATDENAEQQIREVASAYFGRDFRDADVAFEHGQWWVTIYRNQGQEDSPRTFSVVDAVPGWQNTRVDFEET